MVVNFRIREISRVTRKLAQTPMLNSKKNKIKIKIKIKFNIYRKKSSPL